MSKEYTKIPKILLIDGHSVLYRAFYALPQLTNSAGEYTNAVYGFMNIFLKILDEEVPDYIAVAFDLPEPTFRHEIFSDYKGTRKPTPVEFIPQVPILQRLLQAMEIPILTCPGFEADDVLGTIAVKAATAGWHPVIISGDRDLLQVATDKIKIRIPKSKKGGKTEMEDYFAQQVIEKYGVTPKAYIDVKALMGDASDNIPGVPSIGEVTATKIIAAHGSVENAIANAAEIKPKKASENLIQYQAQALLSKELATIALDAPVSFELENFDNLENQGDNSVNLDRLPHNIWNANALEEVKKLGFKTLITRFVKHSKNTTNTDPEQLTLTSPVSSKHSSSSITTATTTDTIIKVENAVKISAVEATIELLEQLLFERIERIEQVEQKAPVAFFIAESSIAIYCEKCEKIYSEKFARNNKSDKSGKSDEGDKNAEPSNTVFWLNWPNSSDSAFLPFFSTFFSKSLPKLVWDAKKEALNLSVLGIELQGVIFDGLLAGYVLNDPFEIIKHPDENEKDYVCRAALEIARAYPDMRSRLEKNCQVPLYGDIELPLAFVLKDMQTYGIKVDRDTLVNYGQELDKHITALTEEIHSLAGEEFNIQSPAQLSVILFEKLGLQGGKKTKQGYSTAADVLEKLKDEHPIIHNVLAYRTYAKLKSTYVDGLLPLIKPENSRIHSTFNQALTATGRISSTEPNLQNIPVRMPLGRLLRKAFIPQDEDFIFIGADYSQIELRVLAHMAGDSSLIQAFHKGDDIHILTAAQVFHTQPDNVTPEQRHAAKAVNFGIVYGISAFGLSEDLGVSRTEAQNYIEGYFRQYPRVKEYMESTISQAKKDGYVSTIFNRRRVIPELNASNHATRAFGERVAMNMPIQGTAADIIKIAMIRVAARLKKDSLYSRLILQVHDELLLEVKKSERDIVRQLLKEEMEGAVVLSVPLEVALHEGESWYDAK